MNHRGVRPPRPIPRDAFPQILEGDDMPNPRLAGALALAAASVIAAAGCASSSAGAQSSGSSSGGATTIRIALNNTSDSLPVVVAEKEGFFTKNHLNVQPTTLADITVVPSLLGRQYDIGFTVAPIFINAAAAGVSAVMISGNDGDSPTDEGVQVFVGKGITGAAGLKGKRIGSPTLTGNINTATKAWLASNGVNPSSVQFVQVPTPNMTDELKAGQIDGAELIYPFIGTAKADGLTSLGDPERALTSHYLGGTYWAASSAWAKSNPAAVTEFRTAIKEADTWISANNEAAYQDIADYTKVPLSEAKESPLTAYTTSVSSGDLQIWGNAMKKYAGFTKTVNYPALVDTGK
jgi:NitT/TauT family transport system substrate-binding protein